MQKNQRETGQGEQPPATKKEPAFDRWSTPPQFTHLTEAELKARQAVEKRTGVVDY